MKKAKPIKRRRGGKQPGSGRPPLLSAEKRAEVVREYEVRMQIHAAADTITKARRTDPIRKKRWAIDARMAAKAKRFGGEHLPRYEANKLAAELGAVGEPAPFPEAKRAKGWRDTVEKEVAEEFNIKPRTVREWVNKARTGAKRVI